jgi:hypothetical protein
MNLLSQHLKLAPLFAVLRVLLAVLLSVSTTVSGMNLPPRETPVLQKNRVWEIFNPSPETHQEKPAGIHQPQWEIALILTKSASGLAYGRNGEPLTLHKYLYAHGNPASYVDPSGNVGLLIESSIVQQEVNNEKQADIARNTKTAKQVINIFKKFCNVGVRLANGFESVSSKLPGIYILSDVDFQYTGKGLKVRTRGRKSARDKFGKINRVPDAVVLEFDIPIDGPVERAAADLAIRIAEQAIISLGFLGLNGPGTLNAINSIAGGFEKIEDVADAVKAICPEGRLKGKK